MRGVERYRDLARADYSVHCKRPITDGERAAIDHVAELLVGIFANIEADRDALLKRLSDCDCGDEPPREMAVLAG